MFNFLKRLFSRSPSGTLAPGARAVATAPKTLPPDADPRTAANLATLDPKAQPTFLRLYQIGSSVAAKYGCTYALISGNRTYAEQNALYAQGRTKPGKIVTKARGGYSNHNFGIAGDFGVFRDGKYLDDKAPKTAEAIHRAVAAAAAKEGLPVVWGGNWKGMVDFPHFEIRTNLSMVAKRDRMLKNGSVL